MKRHPTINDALYAETVESLEQVAAAAKRARSWDNIKTLSRPEAEAYLDAMLTLQAALPDAIEQMRQRIRVSIDQGQKSIQNKAAKKAEREAAAAKARKLLALANDGGATEPEAEQAKAKAEKLMAEHDLTADSL